MHGADMTFERARPVCVQAKYHGAMLTTPLLPVSSYCQVPVEQEDEDMAGFLSGGARVRLY